MDDIVAERETAENPGWSGLFAVLFEDFGDFGCDVRMLDIDLAVHQQRPIPIAPLRPLSTSE